MDNPTIDFVPQVRAGHRAPHIWLDGAENRSVLDWFGTRYVLIAGREVSDGRWNTAVSEISGSFPIEFKRLEQAGHEPYDAEALVLVRPDGIIADWWQDSAVATGEETARLTSCLPNI